MEKSAKENGAERTRRIANTPFDDERLDRCLPTLDTSRVSMR